MAERKVADREAPGTGVKPGDSGRNPALTEKSARNESSAFSASPGSVLLSHKVTQAVPVGVRGLNYSVPKVNLNAHSLTELIRLPDNDVDYKVKSLSK